MKEKLTELLKNKKLITTVIVVLVALIVIVLLSKVIFSAKPKKYEDKVKTAVKALTSESKMKSAISDKIIDVKGAAAWQEADQDAEDFKKEYKKMKKDSDEVEDMEKALKDFAEYMEKSKAKIKVSKIQDPQKNEKNSKIYTVTATMETELDDSDSYYSYGDSSSETKVKVIFYKGKIIDIVDKDSKTSYFEMASKLKSAKKSDD